MPGQHSIRRLEELVINAWPAVHTLLYDGWVLRFAGGYSRRANSIAPLYDSTADLHTKIATCEELYRRAGLPAVFKLTQDSLPGELDEALAARGYHQEAETSMQVIELSSSTAADSPVRCELSSSPEDTWIDNFGRMSAVAANRRPALGEILRRIVLPTAYAAYQPDGVPVACGLGVLQGEWIGLYNIVTDPAQRSRGFGRQVVLDLLAWGQSRGARSAYLAVMANNDPALRLYDRAGFKEVYRYWYRVLERRPVV
jgi:GNAT superfamily N-acetyltransferase